MATTTLTITPNFAKKTAKFRGTIAAGEHVAVSIQNDDTYVGSVAHLRLRVVDPSNGKTLAIFPQPDTEDAWDSSDLTPLTPAQGGSLNLNTVQMLQAVPPAATVPLLFVLDDKEADTLYFKDSCDVTHWPQVMGEDEPYNLDEYPDIVAELQENWAEFQQTVNGQIETIGATAASAVTTANEAKTAAEGAAGVAASAVTTANAAKDKVDAVVDGKADLVDGKVPSSQLPSYVDDVIEVANYAALPATGERGKIYVTLDTNKTYRWGGTEYVEISNPDLSNYKPKQTAVPDPTSSGTATAFIDAITQDANGVITPTKKGLPEATTSNKGIVQLDTALTASGKAADAKATGDALVAVTPDWVQTSAYAAYDCVKYNGAYYYAKTDIAANTAWNANNWGSLANLAALAHLFLPLTGGTITGDLTAGNLISQIRSVSIGGVVSGAKFILQGASDEHYIQFAYQNSKYGLFVKNGTNDAGTFYALADFATLSNIAPAFSTSSTYAVGDLVTYNGVLYRCKTAITTAEAWTAAHWDVATVEDVLAALRTALNGKLSVDSNGVVSTSLQLTGSNIARLATINSGAVVGNFMRFRLGAATDEFYIAPAYDANAQKYGFWVRNGANDAGTFYALADFAPLVSPAFSGTPTAPTAAAGDSSTNVATTAFVQEALPYAISESMPLTVTSGAASTTLDDRTHNVRTVAAPGTGNTTTITATLPPIVAGKSRDMFLNLTVGSAASDAGDISLSIVEPSGATVQIDIGSVEDIGIGKNEILISENALPTTSGITTTTHWLVTVRHEDFAS